jgi:hypothetical protein
MVTAVHGWRKREKVEKCKTLFGVIARLFNTGHRYLFTRVAFSTSASSQ